MDHETTTRSPRRRGGRPVLAFPGGVLRTKRARYAALVGGGLVAVLLLFALVDIIAAWGKVHPGVTVGGVPVGGMGRGEARAVLEKRLGPRLSKPVTVVYGQRTWNVEARQIDATLPAGALVEMAYGVGRSGGFGSNILARASTWFAGSSLPAHADAAPSRLATLTATLAKAVYVPPLDAGVRWSGSAFTRVNAADGLELDSAKATEDILAALLAEDRQVTLVARKAPVSVVDEDADQAFKDAQRMANGVVTITWEQQKWGIPASTVARWIGFRRVPPATGASGTTPATSAAPAGSETTGTSGRMLLQAFVDPEEASATLIPMVGNLGRPAVDARFEPAGKKITIVPSQDGQVVDIAGLSRTLDFVLRGTGPRAAGLKMTIRRPRLSTQQAEAMGIRERISSYSTEFASNAPRVNNIHTLAKSLNGRMIPPGGTFSFNDTIGERTAEKGYQEAPAIVDGRLVPQLGGGICQIGTTIFNTVFFSGFPVIERRNHSFYISHYPKGRDCTVNWGGPDFRFKNDSANWVMISTEYDDSSVTVSLYGTNPGYTVEYTTGEFTNITPFPVVEEKDPSMPVGARVTKDSGVDGRRVEVVRTVTQNGRQIRRDVFTSEYTPKDEVVRVGTAPLTPVKPSRPATGSKNPTTPPPN
jgi:vancomycin resistance protein YoaR